MFGILRIRLKDRINNVESQLLSSSVIDWPATTQERTGSADIFSGHCQNVDVLYGDPGFGGAAKGSFPRFSKHAFTGMRSLVGPAGIVGAIGCCLQQNERVLLRKEPKKEKTMSQTGIVKFFNNDKGFGFIKPDDDGADIFVHISAVQASGLDGLTENQKVVFETEPDNRGEGPKAVNLQLA